MRYTLNEALGKGGSGTVYRARDERLERDVALKLLGTVDTSRAIREAKHLAAVSHPNLVTVLDADVLTEGPHRGEAYLTMELVRGAPLRAYVGKTDITLETKLEWLRQLASALEAVHAASLVHCDVKPDNVVVAKDGTAKLVDFGIARRAAATDATTTGDAAALAIDAGADVTSSTDGGTPAYLAPEQLSGQKRTARSDQFAWGVVAYELLVGRSPWATTTSMVELVGNILRAEVVLPPELPRRTRAVVARACAKDPAARFDSMASLLDAWQPPLAATRRSTLRGPVAIVAVTSIAIGLGFAVWSSARAEEDPTPIEPRAVAATSTANVEAPPPLVAAASATAGPAASSSASAEPTHARPVTPGVLPSFAKGAHPTASAPPASSAVAAAPDASSPLPSPAASGSSDGVSRDRK